MYRKLKYTRWLISRFSGTGLCQLSYQIATYSALFDLSFENYCLTFVRAPLCPDDLPWPFVYFCGSGQLVMGIIMLA